ncbi:hypothetical protein LCGC14_2163890 [marine sediment metagenome]|uniref:Uncharacterized protein n=1 Tax=marine sediment metagenome TaxID=412755 RepID=A0A0F9DS13_9ZZZZ
MSKDTGPCVGCRQDFYNGNNDLGISQCWTLDKARLVKRWRLGWWVVPTVAGAFVEVQTYNCHHEPGRYAFEKELPVHAVQPVRLTEGK